MGDLSDHFSKYEFRCKCGCGYDDVQPLLVSMLEWMRVTLGRPMVINSGCRCRPYNTLIGGNPNSEHMDGQAADIRIGNSAQRREMVKLAWEAGFKRLGVANGFVHVDTDTYKPQDRLWLYK